MTRRASGLPLKVAALARAAEGLALSTDPAGRLVGAAVGRIMNGESVAAALGFDSAPGRRSPFTRLRLEQRDSALRRLAQTFPASTSRATVARDLAARWRAADRSRKPGSSDSFRTVFLDLKKRGYRPLSEDRIRAIIA